MRRDRIDEIEVTPAMIKAGVAELYHHDITLPVDDEIRVAVERVYRVMASIPRE